MTGGDRDAIFEFTGDLKQRLIVAARLAAQNAYVPYSSFPVGAAVLTKSGVIVSGANIENASFGLTVCGERVAIQTAAALGHRTILAIAVSAPKASGTTPCGACRQVMNEFKPADGEISILLDCFESVDDVRLTDLLPNAFGPRDLERAGKRRENG